MDFNGFFFSFFFFCFTHRHKQTWKKNQGGEVFQLFVPEEESCSLILQPWPLAISSSLTGQTHTNTHLHTMCRPDQSLTACADPHCSLKYVSRPPCHTSFSPSPPTFLPIFKILPHFSPSHPLYPLSPKLHFAISPFFFSLSQRLHLSFYPREICPAGFSFFLLSTQLTNPREKEEQLVLQSKRKGWLDGWGGG